MKIRIGNGYDVHRLEKGNGIKLGGVEIPCEYSIVAHSDGDILLHAIMDAILGALAERDIGNHFPDTDEKYKNSNSVDLLNEVQKIMKSKGYEIMNIDSTIVLEKPKLKNHIPLIKKSLLDILNLEEDQINIKATTSEKMGFVGESKGIETYSVCLLGRK